MPEQVQGLTLLRTPFPAHQVSKLPKPTKQQTEEVKADFKKGIRCPICQAWHHPNVVHLDYVGHAALTDRLLDADPSWSWEPLTMNPEGLPTFDGYGGMWIKLTVCGISRLGYGHAGEKQGGDAIKEVIGDALRNAAMRFGAALDLWHKGDLHADEQAGRTQFQTDELRPSGDPLGSFTPAWAKNLRKAAQDAIEHFNKGDEMAAYEDVSTMVNKYALNQDGVYEDDKANMARMAIWHVLHDSSALRAAIKRIDERERQPA